MEIDYNANTLSLRDLKERAAYLEERHKYGQPEEDADDEIWDEWEELVALRELIDELHWADDSDTLVKYDHWQDYCEEMSYDLGDCQRNGIVTQFVDWEKVADAISQDYKVVTMQDNDYYIRG